MHTNNDENLLGKGFIALDDNTMIVGSLDSGGFLKIIGHSEDWKAYPWTKKYPNWFYDTVFLVHYKEPIKNLTYEEYKTWVFSEEANKDATEEIIQYAYKKLPTYSFNYVPYEEIAERINFYNPYKVKQEKFGF